MIPAFIQNQLCTVTSIEKIMHLISNAAVDKPFQYDFGKLNLFQPWI